MHLCRYIDKEIQACFVIHLRALHKATIAHEVAECRNIEYVQIKKDNLKAQQQQQQMDDIHCDK